MNALLIKTISIAFPDEPVTVFADPDHVSAVQQAGIIGPAANVAYEGIAISQHYRGHPDIVSLPRFYDEWRAISRAVARVGHHERCIVIFLSATPTAIVAAQLAVWNIKRSLIQVIFHGNLHTIMGWRTRNPLLRRLDLRSVLGRSRNRGTRFLVLEAGIKSALELTVPGTAGRVDVLPHPIPDIVAPRENPSLGNRPVKFGFLGGASPDKGFDVFLRLADELKARWQDRVEFHLVGRLFAQYDENDTKNVVLPGPALLANADDYFRTIQSLHFTVFPFQRGYYDFSPSGALLDSVACLRPFFAFPTPTVQNLFAEFSDLGRLCLDEAEMLATMDAAIGGFDQDEYATQEKALSRLRESRKPDQLGDRYRTLTLSSFGSQ